VNVRFLGVSIERRRKLLAGFALWTIYGLFSAWVVHYQTSFSNAKLSWSDAFTYEGSAAYIAFALSPGVLVLARRFPLGTNVVRNLSVHAAASLVFAALVQLLREIAVHLLGVSDTPLTTTWLLRSLNWGLANGAPLYWIVALVQFATDYYRRYQNGLIHSAELTTQLAHAQLKALKMQLHPHFLFNTLHAISELIHENPAGAEKMVIGLSQLLRLSLDTSVTEVPLQREMRFVELYLEIEKIRFDERLRIEIDIDPAVRDALVPYMILQPLVENSIKHGLARKAGPGQIVITARQEDETLVLRVSDNGSSAENKPFREGIGLSTTRERLEKLYGNKQSLKFIKQTGIGAEVTIRLPLNLERSGLVDERYSSSHSG
jgi:signal transduction histidine kinase